MTRREILKRVDALERELTQLRQLLEQPFVQVCYIRSHLVDMGKSWDYIDGIGNLKPGDVVWAPSRFYPPSKAVVVGLGRSQDDYEGPWQRITRRTEP